MLLTLLHIPCQLPVFAYRENVVLHRYPQAQEAAGCQRSPKSQQFFVLLELGGLTTHVASYVRHVLTADSLQP